MPDKSRSLRQAVMPDTIPPWVVFIDTETVDVGEGQQRLLLGCYEVWQVSKRTGIPNAAARYGGSRLPFQRGVFTSEDTVYELLRHLKESRVIAHNWQFDASVIRLGSKETRRKFGYWIDMENGTSFPIDKGYAPFSVRISWGGSCYSHFLDNTNFHKTSLANLGESFGLEKLPMPELDPNLLGLKFPLEGHLPVLARMDADAMKHLNIPGLEAILKVVRYCKRDVEVLRESWFSLFHFSNDIAGVTPGITVASMAKRCYQRRWLKAFTKEPGERFIGSLDKPEVANAEELAFHGGRTETFWRGKPFNAVQIRKYDVNSMYPSCMLDFMPVQHVGKVMPQELINALEGSEKGYPSRYLHLAQVTVNIPKDGMGWLGWEGVKLKGRGLCFPAGKFTVWAWEPMLKIAFEQGWLETTHEVYAYRKRKIFKDYVNDVYGMRMAAKAEGNMPRALMLKYLLNSLYGKFGQRCFGKWEQVTDPDDLAFQRAAAELEEGCRWDGYPCGNVNEPLTEYLQTETGIYRFVPAEEGMGANSIASVAGYITASARAVLWRAMADLRKNGHTIFMCDTDSIVTDGIMDPSMVGSDLGLWDLEETAAPEDCSFTAPKHYVFNNKAKIKGIRDAEPDVSIYRQAQFSRWQTDLLSKRPERARRLEEGASVVQIEKFVTGENRKRNVIGDNMPTDPLELNESALLA